MLEVGTLILSLTAAIASVTSIWQRASLAKHASDRNDALLATERDRIDHLLGLLARKEAPAEQAWWMADKTPQEPAIPETAVWDDSGLFWSDPEADD